MARSRRSSAVRLRLALRGDLAHQHVAGEHLGADADDAVGVQVGDHVVGDVRDFAGDFFRPQLRVARVDLVFGDVHGREQVFGHHAFGHDDGVLVVVPFPRHVGHHEVLAERELAAVAAGAVRQHVAHLHLVALADDGAMVDAARLVGALELGDQVLVVFAIVVQDDDGLAVHVVHHAGALGHQDLARVHRDAVLDARADERRRGAQQRHGLALHVRAHEGAVRVVVLQERDERGGHRHHLARGHVHVVHQRGRHLVGVAELAGGVLDAAEHAGGLVELAVLVERAEFARVGVEQVVRLGDRVVFLFVGREVVHLVGDLAVHHAAVRRLDEAVGVHAGVGGQRADEADVRAFRRLDGAHAAVVGGVHVAHLEAGALAGQAARAQGRKAALVRDAGGGVRLVHELGQLRTSEELLDGRHDGADVHQGLRRDLVGLLHAHALAHDALHARQADAELVLDELAHRADAAVAEVIDVVGGDALFSGMQRHDVLHGLGDVLVSERGRLEVGVEAELLVDLVAAHLRQVVALRVEEQPLQQRARRVDGGRLAGAEALVQLDERLFLGGGGIAVERAQHHFVVAQKLDDLLARFGQAQRTQKQRGRLLALAVDAHGQHVALVGLELEPRAAARDDLRVVDGLVRRLVALGGEVHARGAHELADDNALGAVDDERAARSHEREVAHEDVLLLDLARLAVDEADLDEERGLVADVLFLAFVDRVLRLAELVPAELHAHVLRVVLDGTHVGERLRQTLFLEPFEAFRLDGDQIGHVHDVGDLREASAIPVKAGGSACFCLSHEAFPPSRKRVFWQKVAIEKNTSRKAPSQEKFLRTVEFYCKFGHLSGKTSGRFLGARGAAAQRWPQARTGTQGRAREVGSAGCARVRGRKVGAGRAQTRRHAHCRL